MVKGRESKYEFTNVVLFRIRNIVVCCAMDKVALLEFTTLQPIVFLEIFLL